jgi:prolyl-tRNA synthetase
MIWPQSIAPFKIHLLSLPGGEKKAEKLYAKLTGEGTEVLYDDRDTSAGEKLVDADLFGIPWRVVVSEKTVAADSFEVKKRNEEQAELVKQKDITKFFLKNK